MSNKLELREFNGNLITKHSINDQIDALNVAWAMDDENGLVALQADIKTIQVVQCEEGNSKQVFDPRTTWKTQCTFPLVWLTNQYMPFSLFAYHQLERDIGREKGRAGLL